MEHLGQPVKRGIGVAAPQALDEGTDCVVVIITRPVVNNGLLLDALGGGFQGNMNPAVRTERGCPGCNLQSIQTLAGIAIGNGSQMTGRLLSEINRERSKPAFRICYRTFLQANQILFCQGLQLENLGP